MRLTSTLLQVAVVLSSCYSTLAATSWGFIDATLSVQGKGSGVGSGLKEKLAPNKALTTPVKLGAEDNLKIILTTQDGKTAKRPHQAFLLLQDPSSKLDVSYPFSVKETGKAKVELAQKDLPAQFLRSSSPVSASIVIASFGSATGYNSAAFPLTIELDPNVPSAALLAAASSEKPLRYGKLPEIHHIFDEEAKSPNIVISLVFTAAALTTVPILLAAWTYLGGNLSHLQKALSDAPVSHALFVGSIVAIEFVFFLYYTSWNLFKTLPVLAALGSVAFVSGSRALTEVQERRLAGLR